MNDVCDVCGTEYIYVIQCNGNTVCSAGRVCPHGKHRIERLQTWLLSTARRLVVGR